MIQSSILRNPNLLVERYDHILWAINNPVSLSILQLLRTNREKDSVALLDAMAVDQNLLLATLRRLERAGLIQETSGRFHLSPLASAHLEQPTIAIENLRNVTVGGNMNPAIAQPLPGRYLLKDIVGRGATSITFRAEQQATHKDRTVKLFLPNVTSIQKLERALAQRHAINSTCIPELIDAGEVEIQLEGGKSIVVPCVVMHFVSANAQTLDDYLRAHANLDHIFLERFIEDVGGALVEIEAAGLQHGDLHERNLLVEEAIIAGQGPKFWVIDFVGVPSQASSELESYTDVTCFQSHILRAALIACERAPNVSARITLGERVYRTLLAMRQPGARSIAEILQIYRKDPTVVPPEYFTEPTPSPFEWLRVEFIREPKWLYRLFEPMKWWFDSIAKFGNICISGPRGCGKSHYLRALAFQPEAIAQAEKDSELAAKLKAIQYDPRRLFGILFTCRLGEFKSFAPEAMAVSTFDKDTEAFLRHILVLKIWNKTLCSLMDGMTVELPLTHRTVLTPPDSQACLKLVEFISRHLGDIAGLQQDSNLLMLRQVAAVCTMAELAAVAIWHRPTERPAVRLLTEGDLHDFFTVLRDCFPDLRDAQFAILVDDATEGHMCFEYQRIVNSLIRAAHHNHCFKLTHEKYRYTLDSTDGRPLDVRNELEPLDLGESSLRASQRTSKSAVSGYLARVVNRRLEAGEFVPDIRRILGPSQNVETFLSRLAPPKRRQTRTHSHEKFDISVDRGSKRAFYGGWNIVWQLAHGSVRTLLELIEEIYRDSAITKRDTDVPLAAQDASIRNYSVRRFKNLSIEPGHVAGRPLGEAMQDALAAVGEISWRYLTTYDTKTKHRWYETISVDRNERGQLSQGAWEVLVALLKNDLFVAEGVNYSWSQVGLGIRYDLNKVFAPAFRTTYRVRNHLYMSNEGFAELLSRPASFVRRHAKKLGDLVPPLSTQLSAQQRLFDE
jgi:tRNA A-37 threonylcarbamoyl transferase component Bud32